MIGQRTNKQTQRIPNKIRKHHKPQIHYKILQLWLKPNHPCLLFPTHSQTNTNNKQHQKQEKQQL